MTQLDRSKSSHEPPAHVLLIEDSGSDVEILLHALSKERDAFLVHTVGSVGEAIERLREGGIELVLTDLTLPDSRDFQTLSSVQAAASDIPIIVLSGLRNKEVAIKMVGKGAEDYVEKGGVDMHLLLRAMHYAIKRNRLKQEINCAYDELQQRVQERPA